MTDLGNPSKLMVALFMVVWFATALRYGRASRRSRHKRIDHHLVHGGADGCFRLCPS
jgi:hypothetical protein